MTSDVVAWFTRDTYGAHKALDPHGLQPSFEEWLSTAERGGQLERQGIVPERIVIDPTEFAVWCRQRGCKIDGRARSEFASFVFAKRHMN